MDARVITLTQRMKQHSKRKARVSFRMKRDVVKWLAKEAGKTGLTQTKILERALAKRMAVKS